MKLGLSERLQIYLIVKKEGTFTKMTIAHDILEKVRLTQTEIKKYGIVASPAIGGGTETSWNDEGAKYQKEFTFTVLEKNEILAALSEISANDKITIQMIPLCKLFNFTGKK